MDLFKKKAKIVTVSGGKGGTGKTFVAVNLAAEMAGRLLSKTADVEKELSSNRVLLFDADFHLSNTHYFFGQKQPPRLDLLTKNPELIPDHIKNMGNGIDLISFGGDEKNINDIKDTINSGFLDELVKLEMHYDWIIIDTGAGLTNIILNQITFADYAVMVTNPEKTALIDCYKMIKFLASEKSSPNIEICVNQVSSFEEGYLCFKRIYNTISSFNVSTRIYFAGPVYSDRNLFSNSLQKGVPAVVLYPESHFHGSMSYIWDHIMRKTIVKNVESFFDKVFLR